MTKKNILITICIAAATVFAAGCSTVGGLGGNLASERDSEKITPAEFKLAETEGKIVVFVIQPGWIKSPMDLRILLTTSINAALVAKVEIKKERLTEYADIQKIRMTMAEDKKDDPVEIVQKLNAQYVLAVQITDFDLSTFAEKNFYNGMMLTKTCLYDAKGEKIWPSSEGCREVTVGFETEAGTMQSSVERLSNAAAFCITRYLYNCKLANFHITEEQKELDTYK